MDIKAYIESGILELYATEVLTPAEAREVEALAAQYPEIHYEIERIQAALNEYARLHAEEPRSGLKHEIFNNVQSKAVVKTSPGFINRNWLSIAALLVAAIGSTLAILCYSHSLGLQRELEQVLSENENLKRTSNTAIAQLDFIKNPNTKAIPLGEMATVYWNPDQRSTFLSIKNLPAPPAGKQYQLWFIQGDQAPKSAGLIEYDPLQIQQMFSVAAATAFAISLEDEGGSEQPTDVKVIGKIG